jgi:hypothetical protein
MRISESMMSFDVSRMLSCSLWLRALNMESLLPYRGINSDKHAFFQPLMQLDARHYTTNGNLN